MSEHPGIDRIRRFDQLEMRDRRSLLEHTQRCASCRAELIAADPSRAFSLLALAPIPPDALGHLSARIDAAIRREPRSSRRSVRLYGWGSIAAALLLAAMLSIYLFGSWSTHSPLGGLLSFDPAKVDRAAADSGPVEGIRLISSPGSAQVLDLSVGETQVVMIFDKAMGI